MPQSRDKADIVLGHEKTELRFAQALAERRLHHAWLLYGVHGIGKRMLAEQLAARYLCEGEASQQQACGACHGCRMLAASSHPDFTFIGREEKKRDITIAQVRDLQSFLAMSGRESEKRVAILDGADSMNLQAANALLKGLEEPPAGSLLLIVCHNMIRIPATIRSRCMLEHCSPLADEFMQQILQRLPVAEDAMPMLYEMAQGCPGRVMALQDKAVADACMGWHALTQNVVKADVADVQAWMQQYVTLVPHDLIVGVVYAHVARLIQSATVSFDVREHVFAAMKDWLCWPKEVQMHSLRPAPTLLSRYMDLRSALREVEVTH